MEGLVNADTENEDRQECILLRTVEEEIGDLNGE